MARRFVLHKETPAPLSTTLIAYSKELNPQQEAVVRAGNGPLLVVAGAGTGKTRTLIYRVAYLIESGVPPESILLLTFTRRAARNMLDRAGGLLDGRCDRVRGGTFHAYCLEILRQYATHIGFPKTFSVMDGGDAADVIDLLRTAAGLHKSETRFPRKATLRAMFSSLANRQIGVEKLIESEYPQFSAFVETIRALVRSYEEYKRKYGLMDYDDLLSNTLQLFRQETEIVSKTAARNRHVLVDEYQDTNRVQAELVSLFASVHGNVMAVGDDAQSIYRFRGADFRNIMSFPERFPGATVLKLEQNYRSTQPILDLANTVLARARERYEKTLFTEREGGDLPALVKAPDDRFESRFVTQMIMQMREQGIPLDRMGVLFRSGHNSFDLELELARKGIPFVKYGGVKLSDAAHVKDVLAHLKVLENPRDVVAWQRVLLLLPGVGPRTAQEVVSWILAAKEPYGFDSRKTSPRYVQGLRRLADLLRRLKPESVPLASQIEEIVSYYDPLLAKAHPDDVEKRRQDLDHLIGIVSSYTSRGDMLAALALEPIERSAVDTEAVDNDEPPLVLSTIHSAKGLEYQAVFLIQALDGILPSGYALKNVEEMDEELRLLYVALTRAEDHLFVSYPTLAYRRRFGDYFSKPSRFLEGLEESLIESWHLVEEAAASMTELPSGRGRDELDKSQERDD